MRLTADQRKKAASYTDFAALVVALREGVAELKRANKRPKWEALLTERRVNIIGANREKVRADVTGDSGTYRVDIYRDGGRLTRECSCEAGRHHPIAANCHHVRAVQAVWTAPPG